MSSSAKFQLVKAMEGRLASVLTVDQMEELKAQLTMEMARYDIEAAPGQGADVDAEDLMDAFFSAKLLEGRSEKTVERYRYVIDHFMDYCKTPIREITVFHIRNWLSSEKKRGLSEMTLEGYRCVLSSFFGWLHRDGLLKENPCANLAPIKCPKKVRLPYSSVDLEQLREHCDSLRDRAIISTLKATGCRISELCGLDRDSIDFKDKECVVYGKGAKERPVYLDDVACMLLRRYLDSRKDDSPALFVGLRSERLKPGGVRAMLKKLAAKAGVENVHPHRFRRTLATELISHGMPVQEVAAILGHDKLDTTMKYVHMDQSAVKADYKKYA